MNRKLILPLCLVLATTACSHKNKKPVVGDSFFENKQEQLAPSEATSMMQSFSSSIPAAVSNSQWLNNGYIPAENLAANFKKDTDSETVGEKAKRGVNITERPLIADGMIFTLGGQGELQARKVDNISKKLWELNISQAESSAPSKSGYFSKLIDKDSTLEFIGGNMVYDNGTIYVTTRRGSLISVDAKTGKKNWGVNVLAQIRSTPVVASGKIIFTTINNQTIAASTEDGRILWRHEGMTSGSEFLASPVPLVVSGRVIVTYSTGEIFGLDIQSGKEAWTNTVSKSAFGTLNNLFGDISQSPVHYNGMIYVVSSDGTMSAMDDAGKTIWSLEGKGVSKAPWPVNGVLFTVSQYGELMAISAKSGKIIWEKDMDVRKDIDKNEMLFTGVVMVKGSLYSADNVGKLHQYSPKDGAWIETIEIPENVLQAPVTGNGKMFLLSNDSELIELK